MSNGGFVLGDIVTRGASGKRWRIVDFWTVNEGGTFARLEPVGGLGYTKASVPLRQLVLEQPGTECGACGCGAWARGDVPEWRGVPAHFCRQCADHCEMAHYIHG